MLALLHNNQENTNEKVLYSINSIFNNKKKEIQVTKKHPKVFKVELQT